MVGRKPKGKVDGSTYFGITRTSTRARITRARTRDRHGDLTRVGDGAIRKTQHLDVSLSLSLCLGWCLFLK